MRLTYVDVLDQPAVLVQLEARLDGLGATIEEP
jgi:hypothetical protein